MRWLHGASTPIASEAVVTSTEVLDSHLPILRVFRTSKTWMYLSARESDTSQPVVVHWKHVQELDPDIGQVSLKKGQYALRAIGSGKAGPWRLYGPYSDSTIDEFLDDGTVDRQQAGILRDLLE